MARGPDRTLIGTERMGALGPVEGSPSDIITFDEALARAWAEDRHGEATSVDVILGSADPVDLHWDSQGTLFYDVVWHGVCPQPISGGHVGGPRPTETCADDQAVGTIIDAVTGAFIVGG